jgi:hypothetical protein
LLDGLGFRREERLGRPARARDPLRIIAAIVVPWLSKGCPNCLGARDIAVEFVSFGKSLPQMLDAT